MMKEFNFTKDECYNITDIFAYLYQYERDIVRSDNVSMILFCCDIALKRLYLLDKFSFCFGDNVVREDILSDIREHIARGRCTEYSEKEVKERGLLNDANG